MLKIAVVALLCVAASASADSCKSINETACKNEKNCVWAKTDDGLGFCTRRPRTSRPTKNPVVKTSKPTKNPVTKGNKPTKKPKSTKPTKNPVVSTPRPTKPWECGLGEELCKINFKCVWFEDEKRCLGRGQAECQAFKNLTECPTPRCSILRGKCFKTPTVKSDCHKLDVLSCYNATNCYFHNGACRNLTSPGAICKSLDPTTCALYVDSGICKMNSVTGNCWNANPIGCPGFNRTTCPAPECTFYDNGCKDTPENPPTYNCRKHDNKFFECDAREECVFNLANKRCNSIVKPGDVCQGFNPVECIKNLVLCGLDSKTGVCKAR